MSALYFLANSLGYLVAGTCNRSELMLGYFTKHGDGGVDVLPLGHLLKSEVRALAHELGVPQPIIDKAPSAGLWRGQTDEEEMGFSYDDLERYLTHGPEGVSPALALRLERIIRATEHKRSVAPTPGER
jgi:NAD+ synthase